VKRQLEESTAPEERETGEHFYQGCGPLWSKGKYGRTHHQQRKDGKLYEEEMSFPVRDQSGSIIIMSAVNGTSSRAEMERQLASLQKMEIWDSSQAASPRLQQCARHRLTEASPS